MAINDRIASLKPYLLIYNVSIEDGVQYAVLRVPQNWSVPADEITKAYGVRVSKIDGGICFMLESDKNSDILFDSLDYVVDLNKKMQERVGLLKEKIEELKKIFMAETLDKLKTLEFVFKPQKKGKGKTKTAEPTVASSAVDTEIEQKSEEPQKVADVEQNEIAGTTGGDGGSLMDFIEKTIE